MTEPSALTSHQAPGPATVADVMQPPVTTAEQDGHLAAAAYLMKHAGATALVVVDDEESRRPIGVITEADIVHAVADGKDMNEVRIRDAMTRRPTSIRATTSIRDAAESMMTGRFRHLPVVDDGGLIGMVDVQDVCRALLDLSVRWPAAGEPMAPAVSAALSGAAQTVRAARSGAQGTRRSGHKEPSRSVRAGQDG